MQGVAQSWSYLSITLNFCRCYYHIDQEGYYWVMDGELEYVGAYASRNNNKNKSNYASYKGGYLVVV